MANSTNTIEEEELEAPPAKKDDLKNMKKREED
jgi:hypothetical protein